MVEITETLVRQRLQILADKLAAIESERASISAQMDELNIRGLQLLGQQAEAKFWLKILAAERVTEGEG